MRKKECKGVCRRSKAIKNMVAILGLAGVFMCGSGAECKVITYPAPEVILNTDPFGNDDSLFISDSQSGNSVTLNAAGRVEGHVYGGVSLDSNVYENVVVVYGDVGGSVAGGRTEDGDVTGNSAAISGDITGSAFGGWTKTGDANSNSLTMNGGTVEEDVYSGYSDYGNAIGNDLVMNAGSVRFIYGGYSLYGGDVKDNTVKMTDGFSDNIVGGRSTDGDVTGNMVEVSGGTISEGMAGGGGISGGETSSGNSADNTVKMTGGSADWVLGGYSYSGNATGNNVEVNGGTVTKKIQGGESDSGNVEANTVKMTGGSARSLVGGYSYSGNVTGNRVEIDGGTISKNINGGNSETGNAIGNTVKMTEGSANWVIGAYSYEGNVTGNKVDVSGGTLGGGVRGGESGSGNVENNMVILNNVTATYLNGGYSIGGSSNGNSVVMNGGAVDYNAFGGYVDNGNGTALNNSFTLNGGVVNQNVYGGRSWSGNAENNVVTVNAGEVEGGVYGASSYDGNTSGNTVNITGGTFGGDVYGGYSSSGNATYNTVNLFATPDLSSSIVYGGYSTTEDCFTGNTLNVNNDFEGSMVDVKNFNTYNFSPTALSHNGQTILTLTNSQGTDLSDSTFKVTTEKIAGGPARLKAGDKVNLMYNANGITTSGMDLATPEVKGVQSGITLSYDFVVKAEADRITMEVASIKANPEAIELSDGRAAELNILTQAAQKAAEIEMDSQDKLTPFMSFDVGHSRYNVGYNPATNSVNGIAGVKMGLLDQTLIIAPFIELGYAANKVIDRYESTNQYYGAGVTTKYEIYKGIYAKGAFRIGRSKTDFTSLDLTDVNGERAEYKTASTYTGAEIGAGWIHQITENMSIDLYGRYYYSYISENTAEVLEDPIEFSRVNSHRLNFGIKVDRKLTSKIDMYCKASFERELSGEINARTYGYQIEPLSMKGNTLGAEAGLNGKTESSLSWNIGIHGYMGQRKGLQGNVALGYLF